MLFYANGPVTFVQDSFKNTKNLSYFEIHAVGGIDLQLTLFKNSNINEIELYSDGVVNFVQGSFQNCKNMTTLTIHSPSDVTLGNDAFQNSQIQHLDIIWGNGTSGAIYVAEKSTVQFTSGSFKNCNQLSTVYILTQKEMLSILCN